MAARRHDLDCQTASVSMSPSLSTFKPLLPAETVLIAALQNGGSDRLGDGTRPDVGDATRHVRAALLRFLILHGSEAYLPHKGLRLQGAWITGALDLEGCRVQRDIGLKDCRFEVAPTLRSAVIDNLFLDGSELPGLTAERVAVRGGICLRGSVVTGEICLRGARFGGDLECDGATLAPQNALALDGNGLEARGGVTLRGATIQGGVLLIGAKLGGDLDAVGATIERIDAVALNAAGLEARGDIALRVATIRGEVRLVGVRLGGDMDCSGATFDRPGGNAVLLNRAVIEGALFLRNGATIRGTLDLTGATIGVMHDAEDSWPRPGDLLLNRCLYGSIIGGPVDAESRIDWLARQKPGVRGEEFWPQPYEKLAAVLREMGHGEDARAVLIEKERLQRRARRARTRSPVWRALLWANDAVLGVTVRYGLQPLLAVVWMALLWMAGVAIFAAIENQDAFKPNVAVVLRSPEWTLCAVEAPAQILMPSIGRMMTGLAAPGQSQLACFRNQPEAASFPPFNPWMYSLEVLLPGIELGQKAYWTPDPNKRWGELARIFLYVQITIGLALSLLAVAGFSGIVRSDSSR
jgi:hypothetical protein